MKNMFFYPELQLKDLKKLIPRKSILFFDTESCFINENLNIPYKLDDGSINEEFKTDVHVYAWAISNDRNDNVIYGHNLTEFMDFLYKLELSWLDDKIYNHDEVEKVVPKLEIWVHNLQWDLEFLKYEIEKQLYTYENSQVNKIKQKVNKKILRGHYNIIENANIVYACSITHKKAIKVKTLDKENNIKNSIQPINIMFHDSMKITNTSLDNIARNILTLPKERLKIEGYNYDLHRPIGHILTEEEKEYLYNDVYILKEWYNQYYYHLGTNHKTASGIAFERICKLTYGDNFTYNKDFLTHFPVIENYFTKELINDSYSGGITQLNRYYNNTIKTFNTPRASLDIVSSYPSQLVYKPLPIGKPIKIYNFIDNESNIKNYDSCISELKQYHEDPEKLVILKIAFDGFKNNDRKNHFGEIQIGATNKEEFQKYFKNINSGNEYIHTNIINKNTLIGGNNKSNQYRYVKSYWTFELESILKNTSFYIGEQKYCKDRDTYYYPKSLDLQKGFKILGATVFESFIGFFADGILDGYNKKNEGKIQGNKIKEQANKTYINSFYGKLASNPERHERYSYLNEESGLMDYKNTDVHYFDPKKYYKPMASCVTAWGRVKLRDTFYKVSFYDPDTKQISNKYHNNVMYMDTDSLYTVLEADELKTILSKEIGKELGSWSFDSEYTKFKAIGSKKYIYYGKKYGKDEEYKTICKCAGLPEEARKKQTFQSFKLGAKIEGKKVKKKVKGGYALIYGTYTICDNIL